MKTFKLILNCVLPVLLIFSITFNILLMCGFKFIKEEPTTAEQKVTFSVEDKTDDKDTKEEPIKKDHNKPCESTKKPNVSHSKDSEKQNDLRTTVYVDDNIVVTYLRSEEGPFGPEHKFEIENIGAKSFTIMFTDVYIDGYKVSISGLTCEKLNPDKKAVDDLILLTSEWEQFTNDPSEVSFKIKLVNADTYFDIYESERITMKF